MFLDDDDDVTTGGKHVRRRSSKGFLSLHLLSFHLHTTTPQHATNAESQSANANAQLQANLARAVSCLELVTIPTFHLVLSLIHLACTFLGPSRKRGPPKGYIDAIEARLHQTEALLGIIIASKDPRAQSLLSDIGKVRYYVYPPLHPCLLPNGGPFFNLVWFALNHSFRALPHPLTLVSDNSPLTSVVPAGHTC
jgi:hypothetical protein